jgi:hypothetical protein
MAEVDQNDEPSVDVGPADVPIDTITRNGMRTNNRIFNARYDDMVPNRARRNLGQFEVAIDLICCLGSISKTILPAVRAIDAQNEYIFLRSGGEREKRTTVNKTAIVQLLKVLQHACDCPLHDVSRKRFCRRGQSETFERTSSNVQHQTQVIAMMTAFHETVVQIEVAPTGES